MSFSVDIAKSVGGTRRRFELRVAFETTARRTVIYGPSGAGKSLTLQALAGMRDFNHSRATVMYLTGQLPDGKAVLPEDFGFHPRPTLQAVREKYRPAR